MRRAVPWLLLLMLSAVLHLSDLGTRMFHHDEAIHAHAAYQLLHEEDSYRYNPTYHGPLLYYLTAASYAVLGDSDLTARLPIALAGVLLVVVAAFLRRPLGDRAAWWTGLLVTISPICLYYGRFLRMDILELLCASAAFVAAWRAARGREAAWIWTGVWAGLAVATKENAYVTAALVALVWGLMAGGIALRTTWQLSRLHAERSAAAFLARWLLLAVTSVVDDLGRWLLRHRYGLLAAAATAFLVLIPLYTVWFKHPEDWFFPARAISYWWGQHTMQRVAGPPWFHLPRLAQYELLPIIAALVWAWRRRRRLRRLETALLLFGTSSIAMYCYLGEKVPWLAVHQVWAFFPLAGAQLARTFGPRGSWWGRTIAGLAVIATALSAVAASFVVDEISPNLPRTESIVFVQTSPELRSVIDEGLQLAASGERPVAAVGSEAAWPLTWYWRSLPIWWAAPQTGLHPPLVICDLEDEREVRSAIGPGYSREVIPLRSWWVPGRLASARELVRYLLLREPWGSIGSTDVVVLRRLDEQQVVKREVTVPEVLREQLGARRAQVLAEGSLIEPRGLAVAGGRLAVADVGLSQVVLVEGDGSVHSLSPGGLLTLTQPEAVAWSTDGHLLVADTWGHRVVTVDTGSAGSPAAILPEPPGGWYGPRSVAVAADGRVAVSDTGNKRVVLYSRAGELEQILGEPGSEPGQLVEPGGVAWLDSGELLVCDTGNRRLQLLSDSGRPVQLIALQEGWSEFYSRPQVVALTADLWLASDTAAAGLWLLSPAELESPRFLYLGDQLVPTGLAWEPPHLWVGDLLGRVWQLELALNEGTRGSGA